MALSTIGPSGLNDTIVSGKTALATAPATTDEFLISDGGTIKRIDYSVLGSTPAFHAVVGSNQSLSNNTQTKLAANSETFDSDGKYDNSAYRFTPTVAGKYICYAQVNIEGGSSNTLAQISIYKNGSQVNMAIDRYAGDGDVTPNVFATVELDSDDYVEAFARHNVGSSKNALTTSSWFGAYRLIGV